ncbi:MAG: sigma-70 family RNA polymerase sigma factor [Candidatus Aminicenantes bacterium]|nr:sigma-70 family RNA polymerase sigma factor [Candidatus Aminicenantes bacterium]
MNPGEAHKVETDLDQVVTQYRPVVSFKVRKSLGGGNPDWEDVVNEIMMQAIQKIQSGEFRGESSVGTFIYTITTRRIIDYIRQKTRVLRHAPEVSPLPDPHDQVERDERAARLAEAIKQLKPKFKDVLYLYYFKDLSREEVAHKLGITPAKVSERVNYAQKLLRKILTG